MKLALRFIAVVLVLEGLASAGAGAAFLITGKAPWWVAIRAIMVGLVLGGMGVAVAHHVTCKHFPRR